jgi:glycosyltransferase involved in cell wall biosynthesis
LGAEGEAEVGRDAPAIRVLALMEARSVTGPAKNLLAVARGLAQEQAASIRIVVFTRHEKSNAFVEACERAGVAVDVIRERYRFDLGVIPQLRNVIHRSAPDVLQSHITKSHFLIRLCGLNRDLPWIAFNHGYTAEDLKVRIYNQLDRWSLRGADRVVTVCGAFADRLRRWGVSERRITVLHNAIAPFPPVAPGSVDRLRETLGVPAEALVLLSVGRFSPEKAHADLLRAAAALKRRAGVPAFRLVMVGDGPERERLKALCRELELTDLVVFAGTTADVSVYYSLADVFVLPSRSEGSPNVLLEAMASGTAVVATAVGGVPELVRSGDNGLLVPANDVNALAGGIAELLGNQELRQRLGSRGRDWVALHHSPREYVRSVLALYQDAVGFRPRPGAYISS